MLLLVAWSLPVGPGTAGALRQIRVGLNRLPSRQERTCRSHTRRDTSDNRLEARDMWSQHRVQDPDRNPLAESAGVLTMTLGTKRVPDPRLPHLDVHSGLPVGLARLEPAQCAEPPSIPTSSPSCGALARSRADLNLETAALALIAVAAHCCVPSTADDARIGLESRRGPDLVHRWAT